MSNRPFVISTEVTADLPLEYYVENGIIPVALTYALDGAEYDGTPEKDLSLPDFYTKLREGHLAKTSASSPDTMTGIFIRELEKGNDVLHIAFSSGLSSTYQACCLARDAVVEKFPDQKVIVIDSLCASMGQGLLVDYAVRQKAEGKSIDEVAAAVTEMVPHQIHLFTVSDLNFLHKGGRVSKAVAVVGTMLGIKPVMYVDDEGHLLPYGKVRGRSQSLDELVNHMGTKLTDELNNPYVFVSHGDCADDAKYVADQVKKKYGIPTKIFNYIGPIIGTHSGPGTVALFFIGSSRKEG